MKRIIDDIDFLEDFESDFLVLSNYFTSKIDPQSSTSQASDDFNYIKSWYESIINNELCAVVFHDGLNASFIDRYQTRKIKFVRCQLGRMSLNDERFFVFREFLDSVNDNRVILTTDINDVVVNKSPFHFVAEFPEKIFLGRDEYYSWRSFSWSLNKLLVFREASKIDIPSEFLLAPIFNAGLIAGNVNVLKLFFDRMIKVFVKIDDEGNYNMALLNWVVFQYYMRSPKFSPISLIPFFLFWKINDSILNGKLKFLKPFLKGQIVKEGEDVINTSYVFSGFPFCSLFKKYELPENSKAYLIHK